MTKLGKVAAGAVGSFAAIGAMAQRAFAQAGQADFSQGSVGGVPIIQGGLRDSITNIVNFALAIVGIIAVIYLLWGGITYITAGGDAEKAGKGRIAITNAIIGIIIIMLSFVIYRAVVSGAGSGTLN
jgi:hypothetical protein